MTIIFIIFRFIKIILAIPDCIHSAYGYYEN